MELSVQERLKALRVERGLRRWNGLRRKTCLRFALGNDQGGQSQRHQVSSPFHDLF